jgi:hypothetical protein
VRPLGESEVERVGRSFKAGGFRDLYRRAVAQGWSVSMTGKQHILLVPPDGGRGVMLSATAHEGGDVLRAKQSEFRRAGLITRDH